MIERNEWTASFFRDGSWDARLSEDIEELFEAMIGGDVDAKRRKRKVLRTFLGANHKATRTIHKLPGDASPAELEALTAMAIAGRGDQWRGTEEVRVGIGCAAQIALKFYGAEKFFAKLGGRSRSESEIRIAIRFGPRGLR